MAGKTRVIVTVVGPNRVGVLSEVTSAIAELGGNIMDISQKMMQDYFNLIMFVDLAADKGDFAEFKRQMELMGENRGYKVGVQNENVFRSMHRI